MSSPSKAAVRREYERQWRQRWASMGPEELLGEFAKAIAKGRTVPAVARQRANTLLAQAAKRRRPL